MAQKFERPILKITMRLIEALGLVAFNERLQWRRLKGQGVVLWSLDREEAIVPAEGWTWDDIWEQLREAATLISNDMHKLEPRARDMANGEFREMTASEVLTYRYYDFESVELKCDWLMDITDALYRSPTKQGNRFLDVELYRPYFLAEYPQFNRNILREVDELELSSRSAKCMKYNNIVYVGDLVQKTEKEMLRTPNFGSKSLKQLKKILDHMDLRFGVKIPEWDSIRADIISPSTEAHPDG